MHASREGVYGETLGLCCTAAVAVQPGSPSPPRQYMALLQIVTTSLNLSS
jgi:hypothetical protein